MSPGPSYQNILLIKPGAVGDLLQLTPVLRALKNAYPLSRITLLVGTEPTASLFRNDPSVDRTIVFDRSRTPILPLWMQLRKEGFDLVLNFQRSNLRSWFLASAAFPCRILVYHKARNRAVHAVVNYLETLAPLGIYASDTALRFVLDATSRSWASDLFTWEGLMNSPVVALNPGATHAVNRWSIEKFAMLADRLHAELGVQIVVVGSSDDEALANAIISHSTTKPLSLAGKTSLLQLGAILERCSALVSGDTGPMHMATAVGTPVIALFGAADPARTGPVGAIHRVLQAKDVACVPCRSRECSNPISLECMEQIRINDVFSTVREVLQSRIDKPRR